MQMGGVMDKIPIPDDDIVPMETIAPGVAGLRVMIVNVYAISRSTGHWILVDTGLPYSTAHPELDGGALRHGRTALGDRTDAWALRSYGRVGGFDARVGCAGVCAPVRDAVCDRAEQLSGSGSDGGRRVDGADGEDV